MKALTYSLYFAIILLCSIPTFAQQIEIERISQVGKDLPNTPHVEPVIAVHPDDPDKMAAAAIAVTKPFADDWYNFWRVEVFASKDNGQIWKRNVLPGITEYTLSGDPWLEWAPDGMLYLSLLAFSQDNQDKEQAKVLVYKSRDDGRTWHESTSAFPGLSSIDHPVLSIYTDEHGIPGITVFATSEPFGSISTSQASENEFEYMELPNFRPDSLNNNLGSGVAVSDSQMVFSYYSMSKPLPGSLWAVHTSDRGKTYRQSLITPEHIPVGFPMMAVDRSSGPRRNRVYSVWTQSNARPYIMLSHSDDLGASWSEPVRIHADTSIANRVMPNVAVNKSGVVAVSWVDGRNHEGNCWDIYATVSLDGGSSFLPEVRLTPEVLCPDFEHNGGAASRWRWGGDYRGIAAGPAGAFYPVWSDSRNGAYQVHVAKFSVQNTAAADSTYYDFWVGNWHQVVDGKVADKPRFRVKKGLYGGHLEEEWQMEGYKAKAWRGWDSTTDRWVFTWISELGHYQVWKEKKVGDHWYMFKTFNIGGEEVLSRQAFIPQPDGTVIRTSEHSRDGGKSWTLRFKEVYTKVQNNNK